MTVETIYRAYLEETGIRTAEGLDETMGRAMALLNQVGASRETMQEAEEIINHMIDLQERNAFHAGFRAAFELMGSISIGD